MDKLLPFFYRLNGLSDVKTFRLYEEHIKYVLINLEIIASISFCMRIQILARKTQNQMACFIRFLFSPYYVYMS